MVRLRNTISTEASPEQVWEILGDLEGVREWNPGTVGARVEDSVRVCTMADGSEVQEEISDYSPERRSYRYRHLKVPLPVKQSSGSFIVEPEGEHGARVVLESEFEALDPAMEAEVEQMFDGALKQSLASLRRRIEQGAHWDAA